MSPALGKPQNIATWTTRVPSRRRLALYSGPRGSVWHIYISVMHPPTYPTDNTTKCNELTKKFFQAKLVGANTVCIFVITSPTTHIPASGNKGKGSDPRGRRGGMMIACCCAVMVAPSCDVWSSGDTRKLSRSVRVRKYASWGGGSSFRFSLPGYSQMQIHAWRTN